jgi:alanyl-tRNA synthetase
VEALKLASARSRIGEFIAQQKSIDGTIVISARVDGVDPSVLRELAEQIGAKISSGVVVLGVASNGKVALVGFVSKVLQKKLHAGHIMKKVAEIVGGSGGGRPDFAQAGGKDVEKIDHALQAVYNIVAGT